VLRLKKKINANFVKQTTKKNNNKKQQQKKTNSCINVTMLSILWITFIYDVVSVYNDGEQFHLLSLIDTWLKDVDSGKIIGTVFLDLKKAFDLVDHKILCL
jgi:hypothetical protein